MLDPGQGTRLIGSYSHPVPELGLNLQLSGRTSNYTVIEPGLKNLVDKQMFPELVEAIEWLGTSPYNFEGTKDIGTVYRLGMHAVIQTDAAQYKIDDPEVLAKKFRLMLDAMGITMDELTSYTAGKLPHVSKLGAAIYQRYIPNRQLLEVEDFDVPLGTDEPLCIGRRDVWFPPTRATPDLQARFYRAATAVCKLCPHQEACLEGALERDERNGIWGGEIFETTSRKVRKKLD